jgi:hypothetical protein
MGAGKRRRRKTETPYARITEIREASTTEEANECLGRGFVLIKAVERRETDALGRQESSIVYVLGKLKGQDGNGGGQKQSAPQAGGEAADIMHDAPHVDPAVLENLAWRAYDRGEGEWTFVVNQDGSPVAGLEPARDFLERLAGGEDLVAGGYRYRLRGKFLKRYQIGRQSS